jgi:DNA-directed RNA polymerase specialized sigma24 family protein
MPIMVSPETSLSITRLVRAVQGGSDSAVRTLLATYIDRLAQLARKRLQGLPGLNGYDEDLALRSFHSVYRRLRDPAQPLNLAGRDDLWRLLATRTISRAIDLIRRHRPAEVPGGQDVKQLLGREPTPQEAAEAVDECRRLLDALPEPELRQIALWKVEGYTNEEIAARLDCVPRTILRKVNRIRHIWEHERENRNP